MTTRTSSRTGRPRSTAALPGLPWRAGDRTCAARTAPLRQDFRACRAVAS